MKKNRMKIVLFVSIPIILIIAAFLFLQNRADPVEVMAVEQKPYAERIIAVGQLGPQQESTLIAEVSGTVQSFFAKEGETVPAGELVLVIENQVTSEYEAARSEYNRVSSIVSTALTDYSNAQILFQEGAISQTELNARKNALESAVSQQKSAQLGLEIATENVDKYQVRSPWDAVLLKAYAKPGDYVKAGQSLADLGSVDGYKITAEVDEKYFPAVRKAMPVLISVGDAQAGETRGEINSITPKINEETGTFEIGIGVPDSFPYLASNLTVNIEILLLEEDAAIVIPEKYLVAQSDSPDSDLKFVLLYQDGKVKKQAVKVTPGFGVNILVREGLKEGDLLISPDQGLKEGDPVKRYKEGTAN